MKPDILSSQEGSHRTIGEHFNYPDMEDCDLISVPTGIFSRPATAPKCNYCHSRPQNWKFFDIEQQKLVSHGMKNQRRNLQAQIMSGTAIEIIVSKKRAVKS
ncbi:hypothetical protein AYI70_g7629 [Smittium culicis]|uniref:Uncharacterized protein n=1 Tax=Smittium culicis TaxID=133412 RepID=A0A1R1XJT2_9FUNG|nr:hypothetical protein AYI70_g7629 [Smittium culicis]